MNLLQVLYSNRDIAISLRFISIFIHYRTGNLVTHASSFIDTDALTRNPFFALSTKILNVYSDAIRQNMETLTVSSAKIIQEQTILAWTNAAQSCSKALAENAMSCQQQAIERITNANQKAFEMLAIDINPFNTQSMAGLAHWFPPTANTFSRPAPTNRGESSSPARQRRRRQ